MLHQSGTEETETQVHAFVVQNRKLIRASRCYRHIRWARQKLDPYNLLLIIHQWSMLHCALSIAAQCTVIGPVCGGRKDGRTAGGRAVSVTMITRNCVHRSSPKSGSVGEGTDHLQLIIFWPSCAPGKGVCGGAKFFGSAFYSQRAL